MKTDDSGKVFDPIFVFFPPAQNVRIHICITESTAFANNLAIYVKSVLFIFLFFLFVCVYSACI